jgi:5'-nucleotidase
MHLLVTNDDGIDSVFLHELVLALRSGGHVVAVVAPKREQSWIGAAKSRHRPVTSEIADHGLACPTWIVDGTPSDCVNIALAHLLPRTADGRPGVPDSAAPGGTSGRVMPIDAVVSGINIGLNASLGFILASGTIGGAWEGAVHGLPAVALSQDLSFAAYDRLKSAGGAPEPDLLAILKISAAHAAHLIPQLCAGTAPRSFTVHNLNFPYPCRPDSTLRRTVPARVIVPGLFSPAQDDGTHRFVFQLGEDISPTEPLTDRAALAAGYISHTVLDYRKLGE